MCDHHLPGKVCLPDPAHVAADGTGVPVISLDANNGDVFIGGPPGGFGHRGRLVLTNAAGVKTYEIDGATGTTSQSGDIVLLDENGHERVRISGKKAEMLVKNAAGDLILHLDGKTGDVIVGGNGQDGDVIVRNAVSNAIIRLNGSAGDVTVGGNGQAGDVLVRNAAGGAIVSLNGNTGDVTVGGSGQDGDVIVRNGPGSETIRLSGNSGDVTVGGNGQSGDIVIKNAAGSAMIQLNGNSGDGFFAGLGVGVAAPLPASLRADVAGKTRTVDLEVTGATRTKDITVTNSGDTPTIEIDGNAGDIRLLNADCAENFDVAGVESIEPGTVVVLDQQGKLRQSGTAYDKKVAGIISGAGDYKPGLVLDQRQSLPGTRLPVALMGKVFCKVDATYGPIEVGDLLTTSPTPGHAMKVGDPMQAFGAVMGKALRSLETGTGTIPVLVALQ